MRGNYNFDFSSYEDRLKFYQSPPWRNTRELKLSKNPLCEECEKAFRITPATEVHHKEDLKKNKTWENALNIENLESLCKSCHSKLTFKEVLKGAWERTRNVGVIKKWNTNLSSQSLPKSS